MNELKDEKWAWNWVGGDFVISGSATIKGRKARVRRSIDVRLVEAMHHAALEREVLSTRDALLRL